MSSPHERVGWASALGYIFFFHFSYTWGGGVRAWHTPATRELSQAYRFQQGVTCARGYELRMRVQCDKVRNGCDEWNTCAVEWPSAPAWIPKPPRDHLHSDSEHFQCYLCRTPPPPPPIPLPPCRISHSIPKAISHRRTLAPSLQPGTLCRVARGVGLSFYDTGDGGGRWYGVVCGIG